MEREKERQRERTEISDFEGLALLTQQGEAAGQDDDHESNPAKAEGPAVGIGGARLEVALVVAGAHTDGEHAAATVLAVGDDDGQVEDGLLLLQPASVASQDPRRVVWTGFVIFIKTILY